MQHSRPRWRWKMTSTRAKTSSAWLILSVFIAQAGAAETLNKCIASSGEVTYSNLPCKDAKQALKVEIDPAPPPPPKPKPVPRIAADKQLSDPQTAEQQTEPRHAARRKATVDNTRQCNALADKLGRVMDKMDHARRQGYTVKQMDVWNQDVKTLERKKQQAGCF